MWLLSTDRAELHHFISPNTVPGGYAILSHVWGQEEQSFRDTQRLQDECAAQNVNPRDRASPKIRDCCVLAEKHGYDWLWVDAPCIDKSSSAELSEAINSMYLYYSLAEVCYVYLYDVPSSDILDPPTEVAFVESQWHQRGWTLQELIAPRIVIFLSHDWCLLGTKAELAKLVESVTQIPASLLRLETQISAFSVAQRMSWAAKRQTTRLEDEAYCLLGIFGIQMPPLYGEGRQSFYRLQEEIMKRFPDTTLFAWRFILPSPEPVLPTIYRHEHSVNSYLFAPSPLAFCNSSQIQFLPSAVFTRRLGGSLCQLLAEADAEMPTFSVTPYGVLAHIPVIELSQYVVAVMFWRSETDKYSYLGLRLDPCPNSINSPRLLYDVHPKESRIVPLGLDGNGCFTVNGQLADVVWKKLYIAHRPPPDSPTLDATTSLYIPLNLGVLMPFRLQGKTIEAIYTSTRLRLASVSPMSLPWTGSPPITLTFRPDAKDATGAPLPGMDLHLGRCLVSANGQAGRPGHDLGPHWARLAFHAPRERVLRLADGEHSCANDHVYGRPDNVKFFELPQPPPSATVTTVLPTVPSSLSLALWFTPCPLNPSTTLVVNIDSEDQYYATIQGSNDAAAIQEWVPPATALNKPHTAPPCTKPKKRSRIKSLLEWTRSLMCIGYE